jgi:CRP-like cAMP-binding protein
VAGLVQRFGNNVKRDEIWGERPLHEVLSLLNKLNDDDIRWILDCGQERQVISGTVIIQEGTKPEALFLVLEGQVSVSAVDTDGRAVLREFQGAPARGG